jgi:protein-tyrosine-phosphatase
VIIHFVCRGNAFRSIIAEAYLNSLELTDVSVLSSGTVGASHKAQNQANHQLTLELLEEHGLRGFAKADYGDQLTQARLDKATTTACMNQRVYDGCLELVTFSDRPLVWSVTDIGEPGRVPRDEPERRILMEQAFQEIVRDVDGLVADGTLG